MKQIVVGVGDGSVSRDPNAQLITYALGSCVAVMLHDPVAHVSAMLHYMLPESPRDKPEPPTRPWMYADTGIQRLLSSAEKHGASKSRLLIFAAGGAQVMNDNSMFNIGKRNCLALRKTLWKSGLITHAEDTGGTLARTVRMEVSSGRVWLQTPGGNQYELSPQKTLR